MIVYDRLWKTMKERGVSQYKLIMKYGISSGQINRFRKNKNVSTYTLNMLCKILHCRLEDIAEYREDPEDTPEGTASDAPNSPDGGDSAP